MARKQLMAQLKVSPEVRKDMQLLSRALDKSMTLLIEDKLRELIEENRATIEKMRALDKDVNG